MDYFKVSKAVLCNFLIENKSNDIQDLLNHLEVKFVLDSKQLEIVKNDLTRSFFSTFKKKWKDSMYVKSSFEKKFKKWLETDFIVDFTKAKTKTGRKCTDNFEKASASTKRRKLIMIEESYTESEIQESFLRILRKSGRSKLATKIVFLMKVENTEDQNDNTDFIKFSAEEALALIEDTKLSKYQYESIQFQAKKRNANIFPTYHQILEAKKSCYPSNILITELGASIELQSLINHTVLRLLKDSSLSLPPFQELNKTCNLDFILKYGCDGSSDQSIYKQKFSESNASDESIFAVSMVPLCLKTTDNSKIVWQNPHPSSPKRCVPISFEFAKETKERTQSKVDDIKNQIRELQPIIVEKSEGTYIVKADMALTMVDGKVCQALTDTPSAATCYICGAKTSEMNNLVRLANKEENQCFFEFGLSVLHMWIRMMECILHIAYRLDFCRWSVRSDDHKVLLRNTKQKICKEFREKMGLIIDQPAHGSGSPNDGNTARKFFQDIELTSEITKVDKELIYRFSIILKMLSGSRKVPTDFFNDYTYKTAELFIKLYPWYYMPSSIHKVLIHGGKVIEKFLLPIGKYSEEAAEARNKDFKRFREFNTRKMSRTITNEDLIHKLLVSSDLYIASLRKEWRSNSAANDPEIEELIQQFESKRM